MNKYTYYIRKENVSYWTVRKVNSNIIATNSGEIVYSGIYIACLSVCKKLNREQYAQNNLS